MLYVDNSVVIQTNATINMEMKSKMMTTQYPANKKIEENEQMDFNYFYFCTMHHSWCWSFKMTTTKSISTGFGNTTLDQFLDWFSHTIMNPFPFYFRRSDNVIFLHVSTVGSLLPTAHKFPTTLRTYAVLYLNSLVPVQEQNGSNFIFLYQNVFSFSFPLK